MVRAFTHDGQGTSARAWQERPEWADVARLDLAGIDRVVVVAAHPDDESLGAGGLIAEAAGAGLEVVVVVCTAGEHSHPDSPTHSPAELARRRRAEVADALAVLAPAGRLVQEDLGDGGLADREPAMVSLLVDLLGDARRTLVVAPWRQDGHPDHDAAGRAAATAAARTGARLWEYPVWWWHWSEPAEAPWHALRMLELSDDAVRRRRAAQACHRSQTEPLSGAPGDEALLGGDLLRHFDRSTETYVVQAPVDRALDDLHRDSPDPWATRTSWYETRKRAVCLAMLPRPRFARTLEVGCSVGELAASLADRSDALVAVDASPAAVDAARARLAGTDADVRLAAVPDQWPEGLFDLIVVSEVGYFLSPRALDDLVDAVGRSLAPDGVVLLCHWRHPIDGWPLDAASVHGAFERGALPPVRARHLERDFEVVVLAADASSRSVGA